MTLETKWLSPPQMVQNGFESQKTALFPITAPVKFLLDFSKIFSVFESNFDLYFS